jgi:hypothetical protein
VSLDRRSARRFPSLLWGVGLAAPLLVPSLAQASIAGAPPAATTNLPDLISAAATGSNTVQVCYDKPLTAVSSTVPDGDGTTPAYTLTNYLSGTNLEAGAGNALTPYAVMIDANNNRCVALTFAPLAGSVDLGQGTIVTAAAGAASGAGGATLADSVTLSSGTSQTGTVGHTAGPDLSSVKIGSNATAPGASGAVNTLIYTFDKNVDPTNVNLGGFQFEYTDAAGGTETASASTDTVSANTVTVDFTSVPVADATVAFVQAGSVYGAESGSVAGGPDGEIANPLGDAQVGGPATIPTLVQATLNPSAQGSAPAYGSVTYTFDQPLSAADVANLSNNDSGFGVALSDGDSVAAGPVISASAGSPSVTLAISGLSPIAEYAVQAYVTENAFMAFFAARVPHTPASSFSTNSPSAAPIGGNAGLFARGYTTGPDVKSVVDEGNNEFLVYLDQRINSADTNPSAISLLTDTGQMIDSDPVVQSLSNPQPGQEVVDLRFSGSTTLDEAGTQIAFESTGSGVSTTPAFSTYLGDGSAGSVPQIVSFTGTGARAKGIKMPKAIKRRSARKRVAPKHVTTTHRR